MPHVLTDRQLIVLQACAREGGAKKGQFTGHYWRNFDQLERRHLIRYGEWGVCTITDVGRKALVDSPHFLRSA